MAGIGCLQPGPTGPGHLDAEATVTLGNRRDHVTPESHSVLDARWLQAVAAGRRGGKHVPWSGRPELQRLREPRSGTGKTSLRATLNLRRRAPCIPSWLIGDRSWPHSHLLVVPRIFLQCSPESSLWNSCMACMACMACMVACAPGWRSRRSRGCLLSMSRAGWPQGTVVRALADTKIQGNAKYGSAAAAWVLPQCLLL